MKKVLTDPAIKFFISIIGLVFIAGILKELQSIFIPLILAILLFFLFEPMNKFLVKKKIPSAVTPVFDIIIMTLIIWSLSSIIISSFSSFSEQLPLYEQKLNDLVSTTAVSLGVTDTLFTQFKIVEVLKAIDYSGVAGGFFSSTLSIFSTGFFVLLFFIFVSTGHQKFQSAISNRFGKEDTTKTGPISEDKRTRVEKTYKNISSQVQKYLGVKFLISLSTGLLVGIILWIFNVDFLIVWVVFTVLFNFIPNIGSFIAVLFPTLMALVQYESIGQAVLVAALLAVVQNIVGNLIEPKFMGNRLGLNPLVILLSLLLWGYVWGIIGMFIAVPLTAVIKIIISNSESENLQFISALMDN